MTRGTFALALCLSTPLLFGAACKKESRSAAPSASVLQVAVPAPVSTSVAKAKPWYSGAFSGKYEAKLAPVEVKVGAVREWTKDDGAQASGPGQLSLQIDDDGVVVGSTEGSLGKSRANGKVEDDTLRVQLSATDDSGFGGVLVAARDGNGFKGTIAASSPDSLKVRKAAVELEKQAN